MTHYPTDLTEKQWQVIKNILEPQARNQKHSETVLNFSKKFFSWLDVFVFVCALGYFWSFPLLFFVR